MTVDIVIPARYGSSRLPGKPLAKICGQTMLSRVVDIACEAASGRSGVSVIVATDDMRIAKHCDALDVEWVMTDRDCPSGTDRIRQAIAQRDPQPDFVINLQGDTPLTPAGYVSALIDAYFEDPSRQLVTPVVQLSWDELDALRESKKTTPFSGTCAIVDPEGRALWFSKQIIPAIREEKSLREAAGLSPVFKHVGMYGYSRQLLEQYGSWQPSHYEQIEGLEQLRVLENGHTIHAVKVQHSGRPIIGVDSPQDLERVEQLLEANV